MLPTAEALERRRRGYRRRGVWCALAAVLMITSVFAPTVAVQAALGSGGRWLIPASRFFLSAQPFAEGFAGGAGVYQIGFGLNVTYLGLAAQQLGVLAGLGSFWVLAAENIGRWIRRITLLSGWLMSFGAASLLIGAQLLAGFGVPTLLGVAWVPLLGAGLIMVIGGRLARERLDSTWYWAKPELM